jgi:uncharacterized protein YndB with AHSA1/START domain/DNA-binding transcriptional ArsR family regulator
MDDEVFRALADPSRRLLLDRLHERDGQTLTDLEQALPQMTRFGAMKHLRVLEAAGLVSTRRVGREKHHFLNPVPIRRLHDRWLDKYTSRVAAGLLALKASLEDPSMTALREVEMETQPVPAHVFTVFIRATPDAIWRAITETEFTLRYYYGSTIESDFRPGSPYVMRIDGADQIRGEIVEADRPRRLVETFHAVWDEAVAADRPTNVTWELEPAGDGVTKVSVVHDGFAGRGATFEQVAGGWPLILSGLKTLLETGQPLMG